MSLSIGKAFAVCWHDARVPDGMDYYSIFRMMRAGLPAAIGFVGLGGFIGFLLFFGLSGFGF
jgi:hypothetical protein